MTTSRQGVLEQARLQAQSFVRTEAGFAQVTTIGPRGLPVGRTATAFLADDWSVELIQRRTHHRVAQLAQDPGVLVTWVGSPAANSTNEHPHVFDLALLIPRVVFVQGRGARRAEQQTWDSYVAHTARLIAAGHQRAPARTRENVAEELVAFRVYPERIRLEGFGAEAETFDWNCQPRTSHEGEARS